MSQRQNTHDTGVKYSRHWGKIYPNYCLKITTTKTFLDAPCAHDTGVKFSRHAGKGLTTLGPRAHDTGIKASRHPGKDHQGGNRSLGFLLGYFSRNIKALDLVQFNFDIQKRGKRLEQFAY